MNKKGFTLVEIMIVVAIVALLAAIAIPGLLRSRINAQEATAQSTLKTIATAMESFAAANAGNYPADEAALTGANPPYMVAGIIGTHDGYVFACGSFGSAYSCTATPVTCNVTGTRTFTVAPGARITGAAC